MSKEDIIRKLTSRKFWTALAGFVAMLIMAFGVAQESADRVAAIIMAGASVVAYIVGEGLVDEARNKGNEGGNVYVGYPTGIETGVLLGDDRPDADATDPEEESDGPIDELAEGTPGDTEAPPDEGQGVAAE